VNVDLLKGIDDNYQWTGQRWPEGRYLLVTLSGAAEPKGKHRQVETVDGWQCRYDLETGKFDVPAIFRDNNAEALEPE